jgi:hypothetical protein
MPVSCMPVPAVSGTVILCFTLETHSPTPQAALEEAAGVPYTPHMHGLVSLSEVATLQVGLQPSL